MSVALPDIAPLLSLPRDTWRLLGMRLDAIGLNNEVVVPLTKLAGTGNLRRAPLAKWHARRLATPTGYALRMFVLDDAVTPEEASAALGGELSLDRIVESGLLQRIEGGGVVSSFPMLFLFADRFLRVLCDDLYLGGDAVMGPSGGTTTLLELSYPRARVGRALDLGCGAGSLALTLAAASDHVVATDVNPRAIAMARLNTWLNGVDNVELRVGDLYAPVAGESFDIIASQPPFVSRPADASPAAFLFGGERGDELPLEILRHVPQHLLPGGRAFVMVEWPEIAGDPPFDRKVRELVGVSADVLILEKPSRDIDEHCATYAKIGTADTSYEGEFMRRRDHLDGQRILALHVGYAVVRRRADAGAGWTSTVKWNDAFGLDAPQPEVVEALLASNGLTGLPAGSADPGPPEHAVPPVAWIPSALTMAEHATLAGSSKDALELFARVLQVDATCAAAILGAGRIEIASGQLDNAAARLAGLAQLGDREACRLLGDIDWIRGRLAGAFIGYAVEPRSDAIPPSSATRCPIENHVEVRRRATQNRPFLLWVRCPTLGGSVVSRWFQPDRPRRWDLAVNCFAPDPTDRLTDYADHLIFGGQSKLSGAKASLLADPKVFEGYRAMVFLDDDVGFRHGDVDRFFWLMARYQLDLAHPSFSEDSACPLAPMYHQRESAVRFTNVVDTRAPGFSRAGFVTCFDSFDQAISGHGLGHVWSHLLRHRRFAVGVIDEITAHHLRPIDSAGASFQMHLRSLGIDPTQELHRVLRQYACPLTHARTIGDIDHHGRERHQLA